MRFNEKVFELLKPTLFTKGFEEAEYKAHFGSLVYRRESKDAFFTLGIGMDLSKNCIVLIRFYLK